MATQSDFVLRGVGVQGQLRRSLVSASASTTSTGALASSPVPIFWEPLSQPSPAGLPTLTLTLRFCLVHWVWLAGTHLYTHGTGADECSHISSSISIAYKQHAQLNDHQPAMLVVLSPDEARQLPIAHLKQPTSCCPSQGNRLSFVVDTGKLHPLLPPFTPCVKPCLPDHRVSVIRRMLARTKMYCFFPLHKIHSPSCQAFSRHFGAHPWVWCCMRKNPSAGQRSKFARLFAPGCFIDADWAGICRCNRQILPDIPRDNLLISFGD